MYKHYIHGHFDLKQQFDKKNYKWSTKLLSLHENDKGLDL